MKGKKRLTALLAVAMVFVLAFTGCQKDSGKESYKVGFIGPMTGDNANYGILCENAVNLAIQHKNEAGGINGVPVELIDRKSVV